MPAQTRAPVARTQWALHMRGRRVGFDGFEGYQWKQTPDGWYLTEKPSRAARLISGAVDRDPMEWVGSDRAVHRVLWRIYRTFCANDDEVSEGALLEAIRVTAEQYSWLDDRRVFNVPGERYPDGRLMLGQTLTDWMSEIASIGRAVDLWDAFRDYDEGLLRSLIHWEPGGDQAANRVVWRVDDAWAYSGNASATAPTTIAEATGKRSREFAEWQPGDVITASRYALRDALSDLQRESVSPQLEPGRMPDFPRTIAGRLWVYGGLVTIAAVELYREITGETHYRRCRRPGCDRWFAVTDKRQGREFCSDACKMKAYRARKHQSPSDRASATVTTTVTTAPIDDQTTPDAYGRSQIEE